MPDVFALMYEGGQHRLPRAAAAQRPLLRPERRRLRRTADRPERTVDVAACPDYATGNAAAAASSLTGAPGLRSATWQASGATGRQVERRYRGRRSSSRRASRTSTSRRPTSSRGSTGCAKRGDASSSSGARGSGATPTPTKRVRRRSAGTGPTSCCARFDRWLKGARRLRHRAGGRRAGTARGSGAPHPRNRPRRPSRPARSGSAWNAHCATTPTMAARASRCLLDPVHIQPATLSVPPTPLDALCSLLMCTAFALGPVAEPLRSPGARGARQAPPRRRARGSRERVLVRRQRPRRCSGSAGAEADRPPPTARSTRGPPSSPARRCAAALVLTPPQRLVPQGSRLVLVVSQGAAYNPIPSVSDGGPALLTVGGRASSLRLALVTLEAAPPALPLVQAPSRTQASGAFASPRLCGCARCVARRAPRLLLRITFWRGTKVVGAVVVRASGRKIVRRNKRAERSCARAARAPPAGRRGDARGRRRRGGQRRSAACRRRS